MVNMISMMTPLMHGFVKLAAGLTPQKIEIEPGTIMNIWVPKQTVTKNNGSIVYKQPSKPVVVLLHAFATDGIFTWISQVLALSGKYSVYVPDLLFFGGSTTDKNERSVSFQAEFVAKGLEKLKVEKATIVGLSYGATVGFKMAKLYPNLVKSLVASDTVIDLTESISSDTLKRLDISSWADLLMPTNVEGVKFLFTTGFHKLPWVPKFILGDFLKVMFSNRKERNELLENWVVPDEQAKDTSYDQMIYMLWGDDDKIFNSDLARTMKTQLGDKTTLEWVKDAGHLVPLETPSEYNKHLKRVLKSATKD